MSLLLGIILLVSTVVVANVVHLLYPKIPLSIYQIIAGVLLASLPTATTDFTMHPELFMMVVIAPLMFNDGQNQSFRYLSRNFKSILSISVVLALVTVIITGIFLHLTMPTTFSLTLAFMLAAIITPTDAVAVKSITTNMTVPENVDGALEYESLFNDASGIVLLDLSLAAYQSGQFSVGHGLWIFVYVFFGGIIFGGILGFLLINLRLKLMRNHVNIGSIIIPINVMTPIIIYWLAEECHFSGILAVVAAGVVHSILYDRLHLTSTKIQMATTTIWNIISDALNGLVFVLLGVMLPQVLGRTSVPNLFRLLGIAVILYLVTTLMRFFWVRCRLINIDSKPTNLTRDSLLMAVGGIHGTITLALAFSLPVMINHHEFTFRNSLILISAFVILISILVGAVIYPILLPPKQKEYTPDEFRQELIATVHYAIRDLRADTENSKERAIVTDRLSTQMNQYHHFNQKRYQQIMAKAHQIELDTLDELTTKGKISEREANLYTHFVTRTLFRSNQPVLIEYWLVFFHRIKWYFLRRKFLKQHGQATAKSPANHILASADTRECIFRIFQIVMQNIDHYLRSIESTENLNEIILVRRIYLQQKFMFTHSKDTNPDLVTALFIDAFQAEHSYVQQRLATGKISQELANALNEQISTDELVFVQSLD